MLTLSFALSLLAFAQDANIPHLIEQLGHADPKVRESAEEQLRQIGQPAVEALRKASNDTDAERAARAKHIAYQIDVQTRGRIACWRNDAIDGPKVLLLDPDSGQEQQVFQVPKGSVLQRADQLYLQWAPRRQKLVVLSEHPGKNDWSVRQGWCVHLSDGKSDCFALAGECLSLASSPSGKEVVFTTGKEQLDLFDLDRHDYRQVKTPDIFPAWASWSPDGDLIAFGAESSGTYLLTQRRGDIHKLSEKRLAMVSFSPNADALVGLYHAQSRQAFDLLKIDLSTKAVTTLRENVEWEPPRFSPDGTRLAFCRKAEAGGVEIVLLDLQTGKESRLGEGVCPTWDRDGGRIAYERKGRIVLADLKSRTEKELALAKSPTWSR